MAPDTNPPRAPTNFATGLGVKETTAAGVIQMTIAIPPHYRCGPRIAIGFEYFSVLVVHLVPVVVFDEKTGCMLISEYVSELPTSSLCSGSSLRSSRP